MLANDVTPPRRLPRTRRDLVVQGVGDEGLVYDREGELVHILNVTALRAWELCDGSRTTEQIAEEMCRSFSGAQLGQVQADLEGLLGTFEERGLLEPSR